MGISFCRANENTGQSGGIVPQRDSSRSRKVERAPAICGPKGTRRSFPNFVCRIIKRRFSTSISFGGTTVILLRREALRHTRWQRSSCRFLHGPVHANYRVVVQRHTEDGAL